MICRLPSSFSFLFSLGGCFWGNETAPDDSGNDLTQLKRRVRERKRGRGRATSERLLTSPDVFQVHSPWFLYGHTLNFYQFFSSFFSALLRRQNMTHWHVYRSSSCMCVVGRKRARERGKWRPFNCGDRVGHGSNFMVITWIFFFSLLIPLKFNPTESFCRFFSADGWVAE